MVYILPALGITVLIEEVEAPRLIAIMVSSQNGCSITSREVGKHLSSWAESGTAVREV